MGFFKLIIFNLRIGMPDVAQEAMEALKKLHEPDKIELWNPESPITTFWDISSQVRTAHPFAGGPNNGFNSIRYFTYVNCKIKRLND